MNPANQHPDVIRLVRHPLEDGSPPWALRLEGVSKTYGHDGSRQAALHEVSLTVAAGTLVAVTGPSGSGKSTLLAIAGGLERPSAGRVRVGAVDLADLDQEGLTRHRLEQVGYVFQEYNLIRTLTVLENVALPLELRGQRPRQARDRAREALERVGVAGHAHRFPDQLSGGQQQRASIARALASRRPLLLADEPTGALDSHAGGEVLALLREVTATGTACLVATHSREVARAADQIVELQDGVVVRESGTGGRR
jgi:putative ABC transport system ATP-binding protein